MNSKTWLNRLPRALVTLFLCLTFTLPSTSIAQADETIHGIIKVAIVDLKSGETQKRYRLFDDQQDFVALLDLSSLSHLSSDATRTGARVSVTGSYSSPIVFHTTSIQLLTPAPIIAANDVIGGLAVSGSRKVGVVVVNFASNTVQCTNAAIHDLHYTGVSSAKGTIEASSRNQVTLNTDSNGDSNIDVFGPFLIDQSTGSCDNTDGWGAAARTAATNAGVDLSVYQHVEFFVPDSEALGCGWDGVADFNCGNSCTLYIGKCNSFNNIAHELGHNFGMNHASPDPENDGSVPTNDVASDNSCVMGNGETPILFNAPHQYQMGWLDAFSGAVQTVTTSGNFSIAPLESDPNSTSNPQLLRIQNGLNDSYFVSYRRNTGSYSGLEATYADKVSIHRMRPNVGGEELPTLLIKNLNDGENFEDSSRGVKFCQISHSDSAAQVQVIFGSTSCGSTIDNTTDTDGDGVTDSQEATDGTNASDPGSFQERLSSPVYTIWNGFLSMVNILELINPDSNTSTLGTTSVTVSLYAIDGSLKHTQVISLAAGQQFDLVLNELTGFIAHSYGVIKLEYTGNLAGRISYYRSGSDNASYEFAYSVPLSPATKGKSNVSFNTFQPSINSAELSYSVYNWLTIVNVASSEKTFTVNTYSQGGDLLTSRVQTVNAFGRVDIDGGHAFAGPSVVGQHEIVPSDTSSEYIAQLIRYGSNAAPGGTVTGYNFAFPLGARAGNGSTMYLPLSRQFGETNWVEVINTTSSTISVQLDFYNPSGTVNSTTVSLPAYSQSHLDVGDSRLFNTQRGYVKITPSTINSVIAQSMFYYRNSSGGIDAMSGISAREALGIQYNGSDNLFLGMENWLTVSNLTAASVNFTITAITNGTTGTQTVELGANSSTSVAIHNNTKLGATANTYGFVKVTPTQSKSLVVDLFRLRYLNSELDFAFPTEMRPE